MDGIVVTHGTDTLEETAFLCDLTVSSDGPVVVVGAMRSPDEPSADGPRNLMNAVRVASAPAARGAGAVVAMNDEIHAARWVRKLDTALASAFGSPRHAPIGRVTPASVDLTWLPPRGYTIEPPDDLPHEVALVSAYPGMDGAVIVAALEASGAAGLVVEGTGSGNVPGTAVRGRSASRDRSRAAGVVATSRCRAGPGARDTAPRRRRRLRELGVVEAGPLSAGKAPAPPDDLLATACRPRTPRAS